MDERLIQTLTELIDRFGLEILEDPRRLKAVLIDRLCDSRQVINLLMIAVEERIPVTLAGLEPGHSLNIWIPRLLQRIVVNWHLSEDAAFWAASTWTQAFGLQINEITAKQSITSAPFLRVPRLPFWTSKKKQYLRFVLVIVSLLIALIFISRSDFENISRLSSTTQAVLFINLHVPETSFNEFTNTSRQTSPTNVHSPESTWTALPIKGETPVKTGEFVRAMCQG